MYASPPAVVAVAPVRQNRFAAVPLLAICCLGLILLLIASTIVLALIPIYLPTKNLSAEQFSPPFFVRLTPNGTLSNTGSLNSQSLTSIANAISQALGLPPGSVEIENATIVTTQNGRKRRGFGLTRIRRQVIIEEIDIVFRIRCPEKRGYFRRDCRPHIFLFDIVVTININGVDVVIVFIVEISVTPFPPPPGETTVPRITVTVSSISAATTPSVTASTTGNPHG